MGVVFAQHVAHAGGGFLKGLIGGQPAFKHGVENSPMHRLQPVPHIRQGAAHDHAHGVLDVGLLHFVHQLALGDHLVWKRNVLRLIASVVCHTAPPKLSPLSKKGALQSPLKGEVPRTARRRGQPRYAEYHLENPRRIRTTPCCPLWGWCSAPLLPPLGEVPRSGKGGDVGDFELLPFIVPHPLSQALWACQLPHWGAKWGVTYLPVVS